MYYIIYNPFFGTETNTHKKITSSEMVRGNCCHWYFI
uniref:Uncharacterized protein n=1 Tax=Anguilla anguilla TaxID=7936 RepID=A0A0E9VHQ4_ANGAN